MKAPPDDVKLSREEGQALIERLQANTLTGEDRGLLVKLIQLYFWFTFALRETKISLGRLKRALFGEGQRPPPPPTGGEALAGADAGSTATDSATPATGSTAPMEDPPAPPARPPGRRRLSRGRAGGLPARDAGGGPTLSGLRSGDLVSAAGPGGDSDRRQRPAVGGALRVGEVALLGLW